MDAVMDEKNSANGFGNRINDGFLAALSHELRTPLTPVLAAAELLGSPFRLSDAEVKRHVEIIRRNILLEVRLIDNLLDLTRLSRGNLRLKTQEVDLHKTLTEAAGVCEEQASRREVSFDLRLEAPDPLVRGDAVRLSQVFHNLLSNAAKHSNAGDTVTITITTACQAPDSFQVVIADRGLGIAPDQMQHIFEAFRPRDNGLVPRADGLGLGLAIARGLVEAHHGKLTAHSAGLGKGATFTVTLPVHQPASAAPSAAASPAETTAKPPVADSCPPTCTVLLVDDHEDTRNALRSLLEKKGYRVLVAVDLKDARQAAATQPFDLLVSDLSMPDGSGLELMESLKPKGVRGIAISGFGTDEDVEKSRRAGFSQHLMKPVTFEALDSALQQLLNGKCAKA
jgi:CheY-like chemotaxis protein